MSEQFITMFDDTDVSKLPAGDFAYAGYVGGLFTTFPELERLFPGHELLSIAVNAHEDARCLDIEKGDAEIADAPGWVKRQLARGVVQPVLYISASRIDELDAEMHAAGISRAEWLLWSAHYTHTEHLCHIQTCGFSLFQADATQWTDKARGISLDQSVVSPNFFNPSASQGDALLKLLPTLQLGDKDERGRVYFVSRMQALVKVIAEINDLPGKGIATDGVFGPGTKSALEQVQHHGGITADGVCGPVSWGLLIAHVIIKPGG